MTESPILKHLLEVKQRYSDFAWPRSQIGMGIVPVLFIRPSVTRYEAEPTYWKRFPMVPHRLKETVTVPAFRSMHRIVFTYVDMVKSGFFETWTLRFGAPVSFNSLLSRVSVIAKGKLQEEFLLVHEGARSETRRPRLTRIDQVTKDPMNPAWKTRSLRAFTYGDRNMHFGNAVGEPDLVDIGPLGTFPDSLTGTVSRPIRRASLLSGNNLFPNRTGSGYRCSSPFPRP
jgi:hypothetical protein